MFNCSKLKYSKKQYYNDINSINLFYILLFVDFDQMTIYLMLINSIFNNKVTIK